MGSAVVAISSVVGAAAAAYSASRSPDKPDMPDPARPDRPDRPDPEEGVRKKEEARGLEEDRERKKRQTKMRASLASERSLFDVLGQAQRDRDTLG